MTPSGAPALASGSAGAARPGRWEDAVRRRVTELLRFGSVGAVAFVVDMGTYNVLRFGPVELLHGKPLTARVIAVLLATLVSWLGSRHWTFADQRTGQHGRELGLFALINVLGIGITVATLWFSHYVLGQHGPFADNVANVIGIALGTIVRYVGYKLFVFTGTATLPVSLVEVAHEAHQHPEALPHRAGPGADGEAGPLPRPRAGHPADGALGDVTAR